LSSNNFFDFDCGSGFQARSRDDGDSTAFFSRLRRLKSSGMQAKAAAGTRNGKVNDIDPEF